LFSVVKENFEQKNGGLEKNTVITLDNEEKSEFLFKICCNFRLGLGLSGYSVYQLLPKLYC
jgi:hypothetical protein